MPLWFQHLQEPIFRNQFTGAVCPGPFSAGEAGQDNVNNSQVCVLPACRGRISSRMHLRLDWLSNSTVRDWHLSQWAWILWGCMTLIRLPPLMVSPVLVEVFFGTFRSRQCVTPSEHVGRIGQWSRLNYIEAAWNRVKRSETAWNRTKQNERWNRLKPNEIVSYILISKSS